MTLSLAQAKTRKALTPLLEIRNLTKSYDGQHAVDDVSLTIYKVKSSRCWAHPAVASPTLLRMRQVLNNLLPGRLCSMASICHRCLTCAPSI